MTKITCCQITTIHQTTYYEQIQGKKFFSSGFTTAYYYLFKNLEKQGSLCKKCASSSQKLFEIYLDFKQKYQEL